MRKFVQLYRCMHQLISNKERIKFNAFASLIIHYLFREADNLQTTASVTGSI